MIDRRPLAIVRAVNVTDERIAVNADQIRDLSLPTRPTKTTDSRSKNFGDISVELDAIEPEMLRTMVETAILRHLPRHEYEILRIAEDSERDLLTSWVRQAVTP